MAGVRRVIFASSNHVIGYYRAAHRIGLLKAEIESVPGRMRRLIRPRPPQEIVRGSVLNADEVIEIEAMIEFIGACRKYAGELAASDLSRWKDSAAQLLPNGQGQVVVTGVPVPAGEPANYVITVRWAEVGEVAPVTFQIGFAT